MATEATPQKESQVVEALDKLYEFEREPVPKEKLHPWTYFAALLAGEHVAGTEFVIGALFVAWGVRTFDIIVGLILGNLLAVLTWTLVCTPIAVQTRLTLYWYLRKIAGPVTTALYNILNAFLFCILAGCMITVSASSIRMLFGIPAQTHWYPQDVRFVFLVLGIGAVVVTLAILGFKKLAQFAEVCAPWMFFMFVAGALVLLPALAARNGMSGIHSFSDFWQLADKTIWTGHTPDGTPSMTFWQVAAFAWICNLAMHGGMSDMALFRYAKTIRCGLTSAVGMFFGHYIAWICAGVMGAATALLLGKTMAQLDAGEVAHTALGVSGAICVVLAGWTTSNPTLYRAGLAFQAVTPNWPRWLVTLVAGVATTIIACFPFVFTKLLDFVGWYGLLLMPAGAIVFAEHWLFPRLGLTQFWATRKGLIFSWPAIASWGLGIAIACALVFTGTLHIFFMFVPIWLLTIITYTAFSAMAGAREKLPELTEEPRKVSAAPTAESAEQTAPQPRPIVRVVSGAVAMLTLAWCIVAPIWVFAKGVDGYQARVESFKVWLAWISIIHLAAATVWAIERDKRKSL